jgi:hypothetical protein
MMGQPVEEGRGPPCRPRRSAARRAGSNQHAVPPWTKLATSTGAALRIRARFPRDRARQQADAGLPGRPDEGFAAPGGGSFSQACGGAGSAVQVVGAKELGQHGVPPRQIFPLLRDDRVEPPFLDQPGHDQRGQRRGAPTVDAERRRDAARQSRAGAQPCVGRRPRGREIDEAADGTGPPLTIEPRPCRLATRPCRCRSAKARVTVVMLTPTCSTGGDRLLDRARPAGRRRGCWWR